MSSDLERFSASTAREDGRLTSFLVAFDTEDLGTSAATLGSPPLSLLGETALGGDVAVLAASVTSPLLGTAGNVTSSRFTKGFT